MDPSLRWGDEGGSRPGNLPSRQRSSALLRDPDERRPQQPVLEHVAGLHLLDDGSGLGLVGGDFEHRLVAVRVEGLAERFDPGDAVALKRRFELAGGRLDPGDERAQFLVRTLVLRNRREGALEIVLHGQYVAGEVRRLAHSSKEQAEATASNIGEAVSTISRIRLVASDSAQTAAQMAERSISAADTLAAMNQQTRHERADIAKHLGSLRELTQGMDAMQEAVAQLKVLQTLSGAQVKG